jgi:hypothetical protein
VEACAVEGAVCWAVAGEGAASVMVDPLLLLWMHASRSKLDAGVDGGSSRAAGDAVGRQSE